MSNRIENLAGKKFGNLTVIKITDKPRHIKGRGAWWIVHCDVCGEQSPMSAVNLKRRKNCGCETKQKRAETARCRKVIEKYYIEKGPKWCAETLNIPRMRAVHMANELGICLPSSKLRRLRTKSNLQSSQTRRNNRRKNHRPDGHEELIDAPKFKHWGVLETPLNHGARYRM